MNVKEKNLLNELKVRNPSAIEFIVDEYGSLLKSIINKYLHNRKETFDECFNDVLLAIWNNPDKFDNKKNNFKNWICAIAKYRAIDALRREVRHSERILNIEDEENIDWINSFYASENGIEITDDSIDELKKLLKCLSDEDKDLFYRRYVECQSIDEISDKKNMNHDLIYSRISRGKKKIKKQMECQMGGAMK